MARAGQAQDVTPPIVYINPQGGARPFSSDSLLVDFCDETSLALLTRTMTLNGTSVKTSFGASGTGGVGCTAETQYVGVVTWRRGSNTFSATVQDGAGNLGSNVMTFVFGIRVVANDQSGRVRASATQSTTYAIINTSSDTSGRARTFNLSASCSGTATGCSVSPSSVTLGAGAQRTATVTFTSGAISTTGYVALTATDAGDATITTSTTLAGCRRRHG